MRGRGAIVVVVAALAALAPSSAQAASKCQKLSGDDLAPSKNVKLVERQVTDSDTGSTATELVGCVLPDGKLVQAAVREEVGTTTSDYKLRQVAGHYVLVTLITNNPHFRQRDTVVVDLKQGDSYSVASRCKDTGEQGEFCGSDAGNSAKRALINASGQAVALIRGNESDIVSVDGFSSSGTRVVLDTGTRTDIPASSLELDRHVAKWTNDGDEKSARLPNIPDCEKLKGDDLAPSAKVKLVKHKNSDGGKDLVGCVLPRGRVSLVASSSKIPGQERKFKVLQVAGHQVLIRQTVINPYGRGVSTYVFDLERGSQYTIAQSCFDKNGSSCHPQTSSVRAVINPLGQAAAIIATAGRTDRAVVSFTSTGSREVLDVGSATEIPASSLSLNHSVVHWTHSGAPRSATISG